MSAPAASRRRAGPVTMCAAVLEDAEWLVDTGETLAGAAVRLGYRNEGALERALNRAGRHDLVRALRARAGC